MPATTVKFRIDQRVQLHPATDWWMRGARYGTVVKNGRKYVHIKLDANDKIVCVTPHNLIPINPL